MISLAPAAIALPLIPPPQPIQGAPVAAVEDASSVFAQLVQQLVGLAPAPAVPAPLPVSVPDKTKPIETPSQVSDKTKPIPEPLPLIPAPVPAPAPVPVRARPPQAPVTNKEPKLALDSQTAPVLVPVQLPLPAIVFPKAEKAPLQTAPATPPAPPPPPAPPEAVAPHAAAALNVRIRSDEESAPAQPPAPPASPAPEVKLRGTIPEVARVAEPVQSVQPQNSAAPLVPAAHVSPRSNAYEPAVSRPTTIQEPVEEKPIATQPLKSVSLEFAPDGAGDVRLRLSERAGEVHVSLHTADPALSGRLHDGVHDLIGSLSKAGYDADAWTPSQGRQNQQGENETPQKQRRADSSDGDFGAVLEQPTEEIL